MLDMGINGLFKAKNQVGKMQVECKSKAFVDSIQLMSDMKSETRSGNQNQKLRSQ